MPRSESHTPSDKAKPNRPEASTTPAALSPLADSQPRVTSAPKTPVAIGKRVDGPSAAGNFIVALARDLDGNVWVGTEDKGVLRGTPNGEWTQFTTQDGLGDDNGYALCCDRLGRIWVGQLNHGVAVFNGATWKTYDVLDGPLGERIFDIACCPTDGDVWMATSAGLSRYSEKTNRSPVAPPTGRLHGAGASQDSEQTGRWTYFTRADGLPSDQANALAFAPDGTLYVGTQCDGVAIAKPDDNYAKWQLVSAVGSDDAYRRPTGKGLPSNLINDVLVAQDGTIYVATSLGLAKSKDQGQSWEYIRGRDYADKVKGRAELPPKTWKPATQQVMEQLLPEDFISCLSEDAAGRVWVGFRQKGLVVADPQAKTSLAVPPSKEWLSDYIGAICSLPNGETWCSGYGQGLQLVPQKLVPHKPAKNSGGQGPSAVGPAMENAPVRPSPHPTPAAPPTADELQQMRARLAALTEPLPAQWGEFLGEDWATQGDWMGRYGRLYTILCAHESPFNTYQCWASGYEASGRVGLHGTKDEGLRHWLHWVKTNDHRAPYNPSFGYRREAEWDDHGEAYPWTHEGPDIWIAITVPAGLHRASLYFMNVNGHDGANRCRDYLVELRPYVEDLRIAQRREVLARTRAQDCWGGVYKQFAVTGPNRYWLKIARNDSFNTMVSAVLLDKLTGPELPHEKLWIPGMACEHYGPPVIPADLAESTSSSELRAALTVASILEQSLPKRGAVTRRHIHLLQVLRTAQATQAPEAVRGHLRWFVPYWTPADRAAFDDASRRGWAAHMKFNPHLSETP